MEGAKVTLNHIEFINGKFKIDYLKGPYLSK
jgi:hypothetical protein